MKPLYIFDIDGTLALNEHRAHYLKDKEDPNRWDKFYGECGDDEPNEPIIDIANTLVCSGMNDIYLFTGRREEERQITIKWLIYHTISLGLYVRDNPHHLVMRPNGDHTPDYTLKLKWLTDMHPSDRGRIVAAFEDRQQVVDMYRNNGVTCLQVAKGSV